MFKFRTPSLRNVTATGPWGHSGAYTSLEEVIRHHLNPVQSLHQYTVSTSVLPPLTYALETFSDGPRLTHRIISDQRFAGFIERDTWVQRNDSLRNRIAAANELDPVYLSDGEVDDMLAFLNSLTDSSSINLDYIHP